MDKLTGKQERAIAALLVQPTVGRAAAAAKVAERTLYYWLKDPAFLAEYRRQRRALVEASLGQLQRATGRAVRTLVRCLKAEKDGDRIRAALGLLDRAVSAVELIDLAERVEALERSSKRDGKCAA